MNEVGIVSCDVFLVEGACTCVLVDIDGSISLVGEGNGNPHQYSCLENPMDKEAWQATVHGVAKS